MNNCLQNKITHQFTYFIYYLFQDKFKYPKIDVNPTSTSGDTCKTIFILFYLNCFLLATHLNQKRLKKRD